MVYPTRDSDLVNYRNFLKKCFLRTANCLPQHMKPNSLFALKDWKCRRYMYAPNDCILYRGEYENLDAFPVCSALRYKIRKDDPGDVEGEHPRKRVPAQVMWYSPIIPRLKHLFRNKDNAKLVRWHKEERKQNSMLRHPADGS